MNEIKQLTKNIHLLSFDFTEKIRSHIYLILDQNEAVLIDAHIGPMAEQVLEAIKEITPLSNLKKVILTHGHMDHIGACPLIEEKTDASIAIHTADAQYIQEPWTQFLTLYQDLGITKQAYDDFISLAGGRGVKITHPLQDGDIIKVGSIELQIIHTPGHSPGSICIYEPETKMMFTGDALIPSEWYSTTIGVFQDAAKYIQSLERLSEMEIDTLCPGHEPLREGVRVQDEFQVHFDRYYEIEKNLMHILSGSGCMGLWEIFYELARRLSPDDQEPGIGGLVTLRGFLNKLCYEGKLVQENGTSWKVKEAKVI